MKKLSLAGLVAICLTLPVASLSAAPDQAKQTTAAPHDAGRRL